MENMLLDEIKMDLLQSARRTNRNADLGDINCNHANYGATTAYAHILRLLGIKVDVPAYKDNGFLRIPEIKIDTDTIRLEFKSEP